MTDPHLIKAAIAKTADDKIEITLDALIDLKAESLASDVVLKNHTYGSVPIQGRAATCFVDKTKLAEIIDKQLAAKPEAKAKPKK